MKKILKVLILGLLLHNTTSAETKNKLIVDKTKEEKRAEFVLLNMQQNYITCYAFYKIGAEYVRKSNGDKTIIEGIEKSSDASLKLVHETGEILDMENEEMSSKIKSEIKNQLDLIDNDFNNASVLLKKYAKQCKELIENKKKIISFWEKKAKDKFK